MAKSYQKVDIDVFTPDTVKGYSKLFHLFLTWTAFEQFKRVCGYDKETPSELLEQHEPDTLAAYIRTTTDSDKFLTSVLEELDKNTLKDQLQAFLDHRPCNVLIVPKAVRHIFAHGKLTPNSGAGSVDAACAISELCTEFLFKVMDTEFIKRLRLHGHKV